MKGSCFRTAQSWCPWTLTVSMKCCLAFLNESSKLLLNTSAWRSPKVNTSPQRFTGKAKTRHKHTTVQNQLRMKVSQAASAQQRIRRLVPLQLSYTAIYSGPPASTECPWTAEPVRDRPRSVETGSVTFDPGLRKRRSRVEKRPKSQH